MSYRFRYEYGVSHVEVDAFVEANDCVRSFLAKYKQSIGSSFLYARALCMFFKWLRLRNRVCAKCGGTWSHVVDKCPNCNSRLQPLVLSPSEFLNLLLKKRSSSRIEDRQWGRNLALRFSRDNPDFKGLAGTYVRGKIYEPLKVFCDYNEVPLTTARGVFGKVPKRKYEEEVYTIKLAKKVLRALNQRDKAICMTMLQSGQSIGQVLIDVNSKADYIFREIDAGKERIRFNFPERKANGFKYFSFISRDAIQEILKWRTEREHLLDELGLSSKWLFITTTCKVLTCNQFQRNFHDLMRNRGIWTGPYSVRSHMFRKIFEQEASPPDRGISKLHVLFMMGHSSGSKLVTRLDMVGGTYDKSPWIHRVIEKEYEKLEPFINIYSGQAAKAEAWPISKEDVDTIRTLLQMVKKGKIQISV